MQPTLNYRQSRRSACDRCRGFKLRCERDQLNGRSCERCLKAQVVCITSVDQPIQTFHSPKKDTFYTYSRSRPELSREGEIPTALLHRSSASKVRKAASGASRRIEQHTLNSWIEPGIFPFLQVGDEDLPIIPDAEQLQLPAYPNTPSQDHPAFRFDNSVDEYLHCNGNSLYIPPFYDDLYGNTSRGLPLNEGQPEFCALENLDTFTSTDSFRDPRSSTLESPDPKKDSPWSTSGYTIQGEIARHVDGMASLPNGGYSFIPSTTNWAFSNSYTQLKNIMYLNIELLTDLEHLEITSSLLNSSSILCDKPDQPTTKLDLPVLRILNHSGRLLDILQSEIMPQGDYSSPVTPTDHDSSHHGDSCSRSGESVHSRLRQVSILIAGKTSEPELSEMGDMLSKANGYTGPLNHGTPRDYSIMALYCHLIQAYQSLFIQLYQIFLMVPPHDVANILTLPNLQFGRFNMNGHITVKAEVLIELSLNMLESIERSLETPEILVPLAPGGLVGEGGNSPHIPYITSSTSRDDAVPGAYMLAGRSLRETIHCFQALVKTIANDS